MLETDAANLAEWQAFCTLRAVLLYRDRRRDGVPHCAAYGQAVFYLRRKTLWPDTLASAALASGLRDQSKPIFPEQPKPF